MKTMLFHINYLLAGGIEKVLIELLNGLDPKKYHIKLSIAHRLEGLEILKDKIPPYVTITYLLESPLLTNPRKKKIMGTSNLLDKLMETLVLPGIKKYVQKKNLKNLLQDVDVVIDYDMTLAGYTHLFKNKKKVAYCHFSLAHYWEGNKRKLDKLAVRLHGYDKVIMLCDEMKKDATAMYPFLETKLVRLYNAVNLDNIKQLAAMPIDNSKDVANGYLLSVGRLDERQKDFTCLIKGYAQAVKKYGITQQLVIVGDGPSRANLELLANNEGVSGKVIFTGFDANPYRWMAKSSMFLFCSKYEGLPTVLIEALGLKLPIIATGCPTGIKEILMQGKGGMLIKPSDSNALCESIQTLVNDQKMQQSFLTNAQIILPEFKIGNMVSKFEKIIS